MEELKNLGPDNVQAVQVLGREQPGDGGGGQFYRDDICEKVADGATCISLNNNTGKGRWLRLRSDDAIINVKWFGAVGDGKHDDYTAIQAAIDLAERGDHVLIPAGEYALSKTLHVETCDIVFQCKGLLIPTESMTDYLIEFTLGSRDKVDFHRDLFGLRIKIDGLRVDGLGRSRGVFINSTYHSSFKDVTITHTKGCSLWLHGVRETDFYQLNISLCNSPDEPVLNIFMPEQGPDPYGGGWHWKNGKITDGSNNIRFFGMNLIWSFAPVAIEIGGDAWNSEYIMAAPARAIHFIGCQIHFMDTQTTGEITEMEYPVKPDANYSQDWFLYKGIVPEEQIMVRIRNAFSVTFNQCNFPPTPRPQDKCIVLGDETGPAVDCSFTSCRMPHNPIYANNAKNISVMGCDLLMPLEEEPMHNNGVLVTGKDSHEVRII